MTHPKINASVSDHGTLRASIGLAVLSIVGFGLLYSLAGVGIGQALFPATANGSLIERNGVTIGSTLVAQPFVDEGYFQARPSAAAYNPMAAAGSNQARTNPDLIKRLNETVAEVARRENIAPSAVPSDLVTQSGAGLDPHISPQAAAVQIAPVARARGVSAQQIDSLVARYTEGAQFGMLGQPRVNVLVLNLALDQAMPVLEKR